MLNGVAVRCWWLCRSMLCKRMHPGLPLQEVPVLLGAQAAGALISNALWGWWGDRYGKASLLKGIAIGRILPPALIVFLTLTQSFAPAQMFHVFVVVFFVLGALANGLTIAVIGFLMEISPDNLRPSYSGYFNAITAPAFLLSLLAGILAAIFGLMIVVYYFNVCCCTQNFLSRTH